MMSIIRSAIQPVVQSAIGSGLAGLGLEVAPEKVIADMFAAGAKGVWYERSGLAWLYQDAGGITQVSAPGQFAGRGLSKDQGGTRGAEMWSDAAVTFSGGSARVSPGVYRIYSPAGAYTVAQVAGLTIGRTYELTFQVDSVAVAGNGISNEGTPTTTFAGVGAKRCIFTATGTAAIIKRTSTACDIQVSQVSFRELLGNHQTQATAAARPVYQVGSGRLVFDGVDDVLNTTFAAALGANCTVGRAVPGTGAVITTGVNIGTTFADSVTAGALVIIDRALTGGETAALTAYLNQQLA